MQPKEEEEDKIEEQKENHEAFPAHSWAVTQEITIVINDRIWQI